MNAKELAKKIDAMTLDELMLAASADDLPTVGGEYDTQSGWATRCNVSLNAASFRSMWKMLMEAGKLEPVKGRVLRGKTYVTTTLYKSAWLNEKTPPRG